MKIEKLPIEKLVPYARNSRTHSKEQVDQIAASIREFGWTNPVLIDANSTIVAGHGRVLAARKLNLPEVPCIRLGTLTPAQVRAYVIADNKLALNAGWDDEMLADELRAITEEGGIDALLTGFDEKELDALLKTEEVSESEPKEYSYNITYTLVFEDPEQQQAWYDLLKIWKKKFGDDVPVGQMIVAFVNEQNSSEVH
jgi:ParB-like chromosome segregation protein Spo0J